MKICITLEPPHKSYGGGAFFVENLYDYFTARDINVVYHLEPGLDMIFIIDPRRDQHNKYGIGEVLKYKRAYPQVKLLYAVNECDIKRDVSINLEPLIVHTILNCDYIVFISNWLRDYYFSKYHNVKNIFEHKHSVINNACDPKYFYKRKYTRKPGDKIKIVTHHWSNNYFKGFEIYNQLDKNLPRLKNIEFTYIGNYNRQYLPKYIKYITPRSHMPLADEIRKHDVYLTASLYEPGGIHQLEGMSCGLPVLYRRNGGGIAETVRGAGEEFSNFFDMLKKLDLIVNNYDDYTSKIDYEFLSSKRFGKQYYDLLRRLLE